MSNRRQEQHSQIVDEGSLHKYRTEIPNTVVRGTKSHGISIYAKWLYVYLKSVTGDNGTCFRSTTTIAEESGISRGQVSDAKKELVKHGLITIKTGKNPKRDPDQIRIKDIWPANMQEFCVHNTNTLNEAGEQASHGVADSSVHNTNTENGQSSQYEHQEGSEFTIRTPEFTIRTESSQYELKKIPLRRSLEEEEKISLTTFESPPVSPSRGKRRRTLATKVCMPESEDAQEALRATILNTAFETWRLAKHPQADTAAQWSWFVNQCLAKGYAYANWCSAFKNSFEWERSPAQRSGYRTSTSTPVIDDGSEDIPD